MASEIEIIKKSFYSEYRALMELQHLAIEDARFLTFVGFLNDMDIYSAPFPARYSGVYRNGNWSLLGYCFDPEEKFNDDDIQEETPLDISKDYDWNYTIFNGFFNTNLEVNKAAKSDITRCINETIRFIEMTLDNILINDVCEAKELQDHIVKQNKSKSISRIDICIITDSIIDEDSLENKFLSKKHNIDFRVYYWDIKKYNDLKRSKEKRLPINIDFTKKEYELFEIEYITKKINESLSYYLAIFPAKLIADLYSVHRTQLLENNVRVFLQKKTANTDMRKTISEDPIKFFSYNNGISATAETVETLNSKITKITDFQIVNGGQTTATLDLCNKSNSLEGVYVAVKITSLLKDKNYSDVVSKISSAANTQTAVKKSDFDSGKPILVDIERISRRSVILDDKRRSIYYFFERMAGQYNVIKSVQGSDRKIKIWELSNPKALSFDKIDVARWYNAMQLKPYLAAEGAEKQFKEFISADHSQFGINQYKTLVGFGFLFNRIKKLCGTSNGKIYPSLTIDNNGNHAPVAMSTALYTASYLHQITEGKFDYWGIYEYQYGLVNSLINSNNRVESKLDDLLVELIKKCWEQILRFGGASAQEKTKGITMWNDVNRNIVLSSEYKTKLKQYLISESTYEKRISHGTSNEFEQYFDQLNELLKNNAANLKILKDATSNLSKYRSSHLEISNFLVKLSKGTTTLTKSKTLSIFKILVEVQLAQYNFDSIVVNNDLDINLDLNKIYKSAFSNSELFIEKLNEKKIDAESITKASDIIEKLYREFGVSLDDLRFINKYVNIIKM